ncbi:MAG: SpoIIE family protein phosphatase, partial [Steroidobacteraceae bacterium]
KPEEAMAKAESFRPTVILQDLVMPGVEGLSLVDAYRAHPELRHVPTIVLSSKEEPVVKAEAFARGANDYLVKLPDRIELLARIRYHSTGYNLLLERNAAFAALAESQRALAAELAEAAEYVRSRLPAAQEGSIGVRWDFESSTSLGGDAFGYHWVDDEHFAAYVLDVCGHGVGAALLSVSAMNTLSARALRNIDFREPDQVLAGLNEVFPMEQHNNMYFTIWYGVFRPADRKLKFATAGHPPALLFPPGTRQPGRLIANALPIGAMEGVEYPVGEAEVPAGSRLYLFSDGVYEVRKTDGNEMVLDDFIDLVADPQPAGPAGIGGVRKAVASLQGRDTFDDDFSLMELTFA